MAGKRHHIIPKFLQKGFASRIDDETISTWQYLKNRKYPLEISTVDAIVSEHFYGKGALNADEVITELERTKLSPLVDALRTDECDFKTRSRDIAELIAHLSIRSKLIRKSLEDVSNRFLEEINDIFGDESTVDGILSSLSESFIDDQFEAILNDHDIPELDGSVGIFEHFGLAKDEVKSLITSLIRNELEDPDIRKESVNHITDVFRAMFDMPRGMISKSIKEGHIKALIANVVPEPRVRIFEHFTWGIRRLGFSLIMGDAPCLFRTDENEELVPACEPQKASAVYLPISRDQLLVGSREPSYLENLPTQINEASARCSYEQFIASESSANFSNLIQLIGANAQLASDADLEAEVDQIRENINKLIFAEKPGDRPTGSG